MVLSPRLRSFTTLALGSFGCFHFWCHSYKTIRQIHTILYTCKLKHLGINTHGTKYDNKN
jgi:hypothetical protein